VSVLNLFLFRLDRYQFCFCINELALYILDRLFFFGVVCACFCSLFLALHLFLLNFAGQRWLTSNWRHLSLFYFLAATNFATEVIEGTITEWRKNVDESLINSGKYGRFVVCLFSLFFTSSAHSSIVHVEERIFQAFHLDERACMTRFSTHS
jgi:hypothetical protein